MTGEGIAADPLSRGRDPDRWCTFRDADDLAWFNGRYGVAAATLAYEAS